MEVGDRMWVWEPMDVGSGPFHPWPEAQWTRLRKLLPPRKQLFCRAKRHVNTPRSSRAGITWKTRSLVWRDVTWHWEQFQCSSGLQLPVIWPPLNLLCSCVVSLCADEFSGGYVLQPPESKPNFTPLAILAHVFGAIQPYAHLIHVQRLIPHQVCCRVCLLFCCCCCSLIGLVLSSCSVQPPRQLCSLPSKPALAFWQARRSGSWRLQVKSRMMTNPFLLTQSWSGIPASETKAGRDYLHEPAWHFPHPSEPFLWLLNLSVMPTVWGESASWMGSCLDHSLNHGALCALA